MLASRGRSASKHRLALQSQLAVNRCLGPDHSRSAHEPRAALVRVRAEQGARRRGLGIRVPVRQWRLVWVLVAFGPLPPMSRCPVRPLQPVQTKLAPGGRRPVSGSEGPVGREARRWLSGVWRALGAGPVRGVHRWLSGVWRALGAGPVRGVHRWLSESGLHRCSPDRAHQAPRRQHRPTCESSAPPVWRAALRGYGSELGPHRQCRRRRGEGSWLGPSPDLRSTVRNRLAGPRRRCCRALVRKAMLHSTPAQPVCPRGH